jgi:diguanylate cyclase (GGDEF)-like protein
VDHQRPARIADTSRDERFEAASVQGWVIRSLLVVPLWSADRVVGALGTSSPHPNAFSADDEIMALLLANCAAPPIERARLERLSVTDPVTLAFNHRYLKPRQLEEMERAQRYGSSLSVVVMHLDHFDRVNEERGSEAGDRVLRQFADRVRAAVRRTDALVRRGEDDFVLVMPHTDLDQGLLVCERIRQGLAEHPLLVDDEHRLAQAVSMGVATWNGKESVRQWETRAEQALAEARERGGNCVAAAPDAPPVATEP